jgi:hypothetical protein
MISVVHGLLLKVEGLSLEGHHLVERKRLVEDVPSARLQITQAHRDDFCCSRTSLESRRSQSGGTPSC